MFLQLFYIRNFCRSAEHKILEEQRRLKWRWQPEMTHFLSKVGGLWFPKGNFFSEHFLPPFYDISFCFCHQGWLCTKTKEKYENNGIGTITTKQETDFKLLNLTEILYLSKFSLLNVIRITIKSPLNYSAVC